MLFNNFPTLGRIATTADLDWWDGERIRGRINRRIAQLKDHCGPGSIVLLAHGGSPEFLADLLAIWSCGAAAACTNPGLTENEIDTLKDFIEPVGGLFAADEDPVFFENGKPAQKKEPSLDDPALLLFTSGTTGNPKGVTHTFRSLVARFSLNQAYIGCEDMRKTLCPLPTHFGHGLIGNLLTPLLAGFDVLLLSDKSPLALAKLGELIDQEEITFLSSVPSFWKLVRKFSKPPLKKTLKRVHIGSAPLSIDLWEEVARWSGTDQIFNMYGITETANWIGGTSLKEGRQRDGRIGTVWGGSAMIKQEDGSLSSFGKGELLIQTPTLMQAYYNQPALTSKVLVNGWFHTGDIGKIEEDGEITLTGRSKSEINRAGMKILPEEIDLLLERHEDIQEVCVFGLPDPVSGEKVAAACVLKDEKQLSANDLENWMKTLIRKEAIPEDWFFVTEIPKTDRGKINRDVVREKCLEMRETP